MTSSIDFWHPLPMSCPGMAPSYSSALMAGSALSVSRRCSITATSSSGAASKCVTLTAGGYFLSNLSRKKGSRISIALLGDPDFESSDHGADARAAPQIASSGVDEQEPRVEVSRGFSSLAAVRFNPIPGTANEVEAIEAVFRQKGWQTRLLRGGQATEVELRAVVPGANIIHLATHGYFMREFNVGSEARISNPMYRGWLALAGANATLRGWERGEVAPPANDGILMAAEVTGLDLSAAELVVFSACDTVKGEARNGEGILGLHRGVALAGAKNLLLSTWQIEDLFTVEFMKLLYASILAGDSPAEALHKVQASELTKLREQEGTFVAVHLAGPFLVTSLKN